MAKNWSVVVPEATVNLAENPSLESSLALWTTGGSNILTQSSDRARHGRFSAKCVYDDDRRLALYDITLPAAGAYSVSVDLYMADDWDGESIILANSGFVGSTAGVSTVATVKGKWLRLEYTNFIVVGGDLTGQFQVYADGDLPTSGKIVYIDGLQIEQKEYCTTYCDGNEDDCAWLGTVNISQSERADPWAASGGQELNLDDDFEFLTGLDENTGIFPLEMLAKPLPLLPGDYMEGIKVQSRNNLILRGNFEGDDTADFHAKRQALGKALNSQVGRMGEKPQARRLIYHGAAVEKEIGVYYVAGLGVRDRIGTVGEVIDGLQFYANDPNWYARGMKSKALDAQDTATFRYVAARLAEGSWDDLGPPSASGTYTNVRAIAVYGNYVYIGGDFTNFDNIANADYIVRYDKSTGTYAALGTGMNGVVRGLATDAAGNLYAVGDFTTAGGTAVAWIAKWNGSAWSALGSGLTSGSGGYGITVAPSGDIYVVGDFTDAGGGAASRIAKWNGSTWSALGSGLNNITYCVAVAPNGDVYAGGDFTTAGGGAATRIAKWNGSAWSAMGSGISGSVYAIAIAQDGTLYAGGNFVTAGGVTVNDIAQWNGSAWSALSSGVATGEIRSLVMQNNQLVASGSFSAIGGISTADKVARWNGSTWSRLDANLPGSPNVYALAIDDDGGFYIGFSTTGTATYAGQVTIDYEGTEKAYPILTILNNAATTIKLISIRNETTQAELLFDYTIQPGETLRLDLRPGKTAVVSSFYGSRPSAALPNSDVANFYLTPGNVAGAQENLITCFIDYASTAPTAMVYWRDTFFSYD